MRIGCIADDFTGASDLASFFVKGGLKTVLYNGVSILDEEINADVCVIALKTRTSPTKAAVRESLTAIKWLRKKGAGQFYIKYCSTFDSTPKGNIGPICDAIMEELNVYYTILCPALPVNGRTVENGCLYVNNTPLHESSMKDHPLTPMWDCNLENLMNVQSSYPSFRISFESETQYHIKELKKKHDKFYLIPDVKDEQDLFEVSDEFHNLKLLTGGSGLAYPLAKKKYTGNDTLKEFGKSDKPALILSGSTSEKTRSQVEKYQDSGGKSYFINPENLIKGEESVEKIKRFLSRNKNESILIYSSDTPENVKKFQEQGKERVSQLLEETMAEIAEFGTKKGYYRIVVAGGETSGAVTKKLGFDKYYIGNSVAPGVPILIPVNRSHIRLVLKSGNFGENNFFNHALQLV